MPLYGSFFKGEGVSQYDTAGFDATQNIDIYSQIGTAQCQLALISESATPNETCVQATDGSGQVFFFSTSSGKTWKRTTGAVYSLVNTNANGAHISAFYSPSLNKIVYTTSTKVGYTDSTTFTDSFGTFSNGSAYHPITDVNLTVFIGDGKYIASISQALSFSANALDLPARYSVTCLKNEKNWVLIGTIIGTTVSLSTIYLWDSYSSSWTTEDDVYEIGINCFIPADNKTYAQCGTSGNIFLWTGGDLEYFKQVRGITTAVGQEKVTVIGSKALLANGTRVYSLNHNIRGVEDAIVYEYTTTTGTIASIGVTGSQLLVSNGSNIDKIDSNYATATLSTPLNLEVFTEIVVPYESMPSGCSLSLETNINGAGYVAETSFKNDTTKFRYVLTDGITYNGDINFGKARITLTPNGATTPVIQNVILK